MAVGEGVTAVAKEETAQGRRTIKLKSSDGEEHEMSQMAAMLSKALLHQMDRGTIPLPNVASNTLNLVIRYCEKHAEVAPVTGNNSDPSSSAAASSGNPPAPATTKEGKDGLAKWDKEFIDGLEQRPLFNLILAANYLDITGLLDLTCSKIACMMKDKTPVQIRKMFNIVSDFTKEEEGAIRKEQPWAFEDSD